MNASLLVGFFIIYIIAGASWLDVIPDSYGKDLINGVLHPFRGAILIFGMWFSGLIGKIEHDKFLFLYFLGWLLIILPPFFISTLQYIFILDGSIYVNYLINIALSIYILWSVLLVVVTPAYIFDFLRNEQFILSFITKKIIFYIVAPILSISLPLYILNGFSILSFTTSNDISLIHSIWLLVKASTQILIILTAYFVVIRQVFKNKDLKPIVLSISISLLTFVVCFSSVNISDVIVNITSGVIVLVVGNMLTKKN